MSEESKKLHALCVQAYVLYIISIVLSAVPNVTVSLVALVLGLMGIVMAYRAQGRSIGTIYESHVRWLVRTFWIGGAVLLPIATVIFAFVIWKYGDTTAIARLSEQIMSSGRRFDQAMLDEAMLQYMRDNMRLMMLAGLPTLGLSALWWVARSVKGLNLVHKHEPIEKPEAFF